MARTSSQDPMYRAKVRSWIETEGEILLLIRFPNMGGAKSWEFMTTFEQYEQRITQLQPRTSIIVFRNHPLPLRGVADAQFIEHALAMMHSGNEYVLVGLDLIERYGFTEYPTFYIDTQAELRESLADSFGQRMAFGPYPDWLQDGEFVISAYIPDVDGTIHGAAY